jgi:hypothetical protein
MRVARTRPQQKEKKEKKNYTWSQPRYKSNAMTSKAVRHQPIFYCPPWLGREFGRWNVALAVAIERVEARVDVVARFPGMGNKEWTVALCGESALRTKYWVLPLSQPVGFWQCC